MAVSKTRTRAEIRVIYDLGQRIFAENRAQELVARASELPTDIEWHLIGHLQQNKVRMVLPDVDCIQSLDSERLWHKINEEAERISKKVNALLQIKIAKEESKFGWDFRELDKVLREKILSTTPWVNIQGVMGMTTLTKDEELIRLEMRQLKTCFHHLQRNYFQDNKEFKIISMGMSGDYKIAAEEGSNLVRVGSLLFPH